MRIGYLVDTHGGPYDQPVPGRRNAVDTMERIIEEAVLAERSGFHSIQIPERHGRTETYIPSPLQLMTILARETSRVAIGSYACIATLYHPMQIAEWTAVVDNLSRGRAYQTLARGYHPGYWDFFGVPQEKLLGRLLESIEVINRAFAGERFSFDGAHYQVRNALLSPQPYQEHVPLWGAGQLPAAIRRSGRIGDCWTCDPFPILQETWDVQAGAYRAEAERNGKTPFIVLMRDGWVADSFEDAARDFGTHWVEEMKFYFRAGIFAHHPQYDEEWKITPEATRADVVVGTPQQCIEQIERFEEELGVQYITMRFRMPTGPSFEKARECIQRFGEEVCSYFHRKPDPAMDHPAIPEACRW
jgi:alkanesulfonate monooxygenase SsuD/methylene tetrahydromethanopterin reductase-like flavin-dependent oxidoreductase (luciferase family)